MKSLRQSLCVLALVGTMMMMIPAARAQEDPPAAPPAAKTLYEPTVPGTIRVHLFLQTATQVQVMVSILMPKADLPWFIEQTNNKSGPDTLIKLADALYQRSKDAPPQEMVLLASSSIGLPVGPVELASVDEECLLRPEEGQKIDLNVAYRTLNEEDPAGPAVYAYFSDEERKELNRQSRLFEFVPSGRYPILIDQMADTKDKMRLSDPPAEVPILGGTRFEGTRTYVFHRKLLFLYGPGVGLLATYLGGYEEPWKWGERRLYGNREYPKFQRTIEIAWYYIPGERPIEWTGNRWLEKHDDGKLYVKKKSPI